MISDMRTKFKKGGYQVIIWITLLSMVGIASLPELIKRLWGEPTEWAISVNGLKASTTRYYQKIEEQKQMINMLKKQFGAYADMILNAYGLNNDPKEMAIKSLIQELLLSDVANRLKISISPEFMHQEIIKQLPPEVIGTGKIDLLSLSRMLNYPSLQDFENDIERNLKNKLVLEFTKAASYVPEFYIKNEFNKLYAKKKYSILVFPFDKYLANAKKTPLNNDEVVKFYNEKSKSERRYWVPEKREGLVIEFLPEKYGVNVNDKEIESYYNKNKKLYIDKPVQIQVKRILFKIADPKEKGSVKQLALKVREEVLKDPAKFSEYVKQYSQDKDAKDGIIEFQKGQKDPALEKAAFELENNNDISKVVETKDGFEIVQRISKKPATFKKLEDVKNQIKEQIVKERFKKLFDLDAKQFVRKIQSYSAEATKDKSSENKNELLNSFVKTKNGSQKKIELVEKNQMPQVQKLYSIRNEEGFIYYIEGDKGYIVELTKVNKTYLPTLETIRKTVEEDIYKQKALSNLKNDLNKAKIGESFEKLKDQYGAKLINTGWINQVENPDEQMLKKEGIPVQNLLGLEKENSVSDFIPFDTLSATQDRENNNGYLIKVDTVEPFNEQNFEERKAEIQDNLERQNAMELESGFIASLQKNAKIEINNKNLKTNTHNFPR